MTKEEWKELEKRCGENKATDDSFIGCLSSGEIKIKKAYKEIFGVDFPEDYSSWDRREYIYGEGAKAIAGERGIITLEELNTIKPGE